MIVVEELGLVRNHSTVGDFLKKYYIETTFQSHHIIFCPILSKNPNTFLEHSLFIFFQIKIQPELCFWAQLD